MFDCLVFESTYVVALYRNNGDIQAGNWPFLFKLNNSELDEQDTLENGYLARRKAS